MWLLSLSLVDVGFGMKDSTVGLMPHSFNRYYYLTYAKLRFPYCAPKVKEEGAWNLILGAYSLQKIGALNIRETQKKKQIKE